MNYHNIITVKHVSFVYSVDKNFTEQEIQFANSLNIPK